MTSSIANSAAVAHSLKMGVLTEVSNDAERERAMALGAKW
ncbi:Indole-3-glycerol phosphate synthase / Phosphoribosylanthranilate isomerase [Salmonella enterica subsp. arizonae]|uniref:Indole-3-glycerol phosphate synthase / Phosphoribosylanthranilate isomerase n=1 Tax=Salmonella enterica subsp. arizonae TaxID=59203 RepID=A0A379SU28_SALER|nr:Indole-3-glycerol phosphate synthase / Phosphoribosylanthranilate isomerase [Salmonella enterica subsp. arizonae]